MMPVRCYMPSRPRRAPRGSEKTAVMNFRIQPLTRRAVEDAAKASGRTVSAECEAQLQRALFGMGGGLWPILQIVSDNLNKIAELKERAWADDPILFDRAFNAIVAMLEMCRPSGSIHRDATENELQADRNVMLNAILRIYEVNTSAPLGRLSPEQRHLVKLKEQLGAIGAEPVLRRFGALAHKASTTESPAATDAKELWRITRLLLAEPAILSAAGSMTVDVTVMRRGPDGKLAPVEENKK
jgi:hypothetical protein